MRQIFSVIFVISSFNSIGQTVLDSDGLNNPNNVYLYSLKEYCKSLDSSKYQVVYVRNDNFIGDSWPNKIQSFKIKYLKKDIDYIDAIEKNKGIVTIVGISPFDFRNGEFSVAV